MSQLVRKYSQVRNDGTHHEMSIRRSESTLYLESLTVTGPTGIWRGETGAVYSGALRELNKQLTDIRYNARGGLKPFQLEVKAMHAAIIMREGVNGQPHYEVSGDIASVTLYFNGLHMLEEFTRGLEETLSWAA